MAVTHPALLEFGALDTDCIRELAERDEIEHEIAARLALEAMGRGVLPIVNLVAADEQVHRLRHPLPAGARRERYAMPVLGGAQRGTPPCYPTGLGTKAEALTAQDGCVHLALGEGPVAQVHCRLAERQADHEADAPGRTLLPGS